MQRRRNIIEIEIIVDLRIQRKLDRLKNTDNKLKLGTRKYKLFQGDRNLTLTHLGEFEAKFLNQLMAEREHDVVLLNNGRVVKLLK